MKRFLYVMSALVLMFSVGCSDNSDSTQPSTGDHSEKIIKSINTNCGDQSCLQ